MKKFIVSALVLAGLVLGVVTLPVGTAWAEEEQNSSPNSLQMSPSGVRLTLVAGETLEGHAANCPKTEEGCAIKVTNTGTEGFRFRVYITPYVVSGEENELTFDEEKATVLHANFSLDYSSECEWGVCEGGRVCFAAWRVACDSVSCFDPDGHSGWISVCCDLGANYE